MKTIILANGEFPKAEKTLQILKSADRIICCDGAANNLIVYGLEPNIIIGDMDSLADDIKQKYKDRIVTLKEQNTNDLTKAVNWGIANNISKFYILGATGKREDHSIANIALLSEYSKIADVQIISDYGVFKSINKSTKFESFIGQQISIFAMDYNTIIKSDGLKYPLNNMNLKNWWNGTLNEATSNSFSVSFEQGTLIVYQLF